VACEIVTALQSMVTRRVNAFDPVVITTTRIHAGTTDNVIAENASLHGTLRATSEHSRLAAEEGIHRVAQGIAQAHGASAVVEVVDGYPVTVNEPGVMGLAREVSDGLLGEGAFAEMPTPIMGGEDFSYVLERWPGAMVFLGVREQGVRDAAPVHSNRMLLNEDGMVPGIALYAGMALGFLAQ